MSGESDREFLAAMCRDRAGLKIDPDRAYLIDSRLAPVVRREGFASIAQFVDVIRVGNEERLAWAAVEALAQNETAFFRDFEVFDRLGSEVLPDLVCARAGQPVRVWSAGCGSGQEAHSLAMLVDEQVGLAGKVELLASDLSEKNLEKAQSGLYSQFEVQRGLPARRLVGHFENRGELFAISPRIRQMTRWRRVNLLDDISDVGKFDLILCRYVLTQMAASAQSQVLKSLRSALAPGGRLVLGRGEAAGDLLMPLIADNGVFGASTVKARSAA